MEVSVMSAQKASTNPARKSANSTVHPSQAPLTSPRLSHIDWREQHVFDEAFLPPGLMDTVTAFDSGRNFSEYRKSTARCSPAQREIWKLYQHARRIRTPQYRLQAMTSLMAICAAFEVDNTAPTGEAV
jgi:hypothetical protein